jgi:uridine phosphorylase
VSDQTPPAVPPILAEKYYDAPSVFDVANLMREARRQKHLPAGDVPSVCVLDPDGDLVEYLRASGRAHPHPAWACYHTTLDVFDLNGIPVGVVGRAVGASFAVLIAEELFVSGCRLLISVTSAGQIIPLGPTPYFVLIERALRDEGTSYHYLPPARYSALDPALRARLAEAWDAQGVSRYTGSSWTTDAPFRETAAAIAAARADPPLQDTTPPPPPARAEGIAAVEMEASALYALATAKGYPIVCFAHVTNTMAIDGDDFEKGPDQGSQAALAVIAATLRCWRESE